MNQVLHLSDSSKELILLFNYIVRFLLFLILKSHSSNPILSHANFSFRFKVTNVLIKFWRRWSNLFSGSYNEAKYSGSYQKQYHTTNRQPSNYHNNNHIHPGAIQKMYLPPRTRKNYQRHNYRRLKNMHRHMYTLWIKYVFIYLKFTLFFVNTVPWISLLSLEVLVQSNWNTNWTVKIPIVDLIELNCN